MTQYEIEQKFDRKNIRAHILRDISSGLEEPIELSVRLLTEYMTNKTYYMSKLDRLQKLDASLEGVLKIVTEVCILVLPLSTAQPIQGVAGQLGILLDYEDVLEGVKTAAEILAVMAQTDLFNLIPARSSETGSIMIISNYRLEDSTLDFINQTKYLPPMIELPKTITSNYCSGYLTRTDSVILGAGNHHDGELGLDVINILNQIPLAIDTRMFEFYEQSKKKLDTDEKQRNHTKLVNDSAVVVNDLLDAGNTFWFTHKVDKRGRIYCQGYHASYQGTSYKKSLINLAKKEVIV
jgi:hypothetical protein